MKATNVSYTNPGDGKWTPQESQLHKAEVRRDMGADQMKGGATIATAGAVEAVAGAHMQNGVATSSGAFHTAWGSREAYQGYRDYQKNDMLMKDLKTQEKDYLAKH